jgi:hypothetical protein
MQSRPTDAGSIHQRGFQGSGFEPIDVRIYRWPLHREIKRAFRLPPLVEPRLRYLCSPYAQDSSLFVLRLQPSPHRKFAL